MRSCRGYIVTNLLTCNFVVYRLPCICFFFARMSYYIHVVVKVSKRIFCVSRFFSMHTRSFEKQ